MSRSSSDGHQHTVSRSRYSRRCCGETDIKEGQTIFVDTGARFRILGLEIRGVFHFEVKYLSGTSVVRKEHGEFRSGFLDCEFISGVQDFDYHVTWSDSALGVAFKVVVLFGLAFQLQFEGDCWSRESC